LEIAPDIVDFFSAMGMAALVPGFNAPLEIQYAKIFETENYFMFYWGAGQKDWCPNNYRQLVEARRVGAGFRRPLAALVYNGQKKVDYKERFQWLFLKAPEYDRFNPAAQKVQEFVSQVLSTVDASSSGDQTRA
jgi:hypothetical protein